MKHWMVGPPERPTHHAVGMLDQDEVKPWMALMGSPERSEKRARIVIGEDGQHRTEMVDYQSRVGIQAGQQIE